MNISMPCFLSVFRLPNITITNTINEIGDQNDMSMLNKRSRDFDGELISRRAALVGIDGKLEESNADNDKMSMYNEIQ